MIHKLDSLIKLVKWILNIPLIILCIDEFQKAVRVLRMDSRVKKSLFSKVNFALGVTFAIAYIPNICLRESRSCIFLIASWLCLYSVSNRISRNLEECANVEEKRNNLNT